MALAMNSEADTVQASLAPTDAHGLLGLALVPELDSELKGDADDDELSAGEMVGHYTLLKQIGKGGFGIVWKAEQREPIRREVALKVIRVGMNSRSVIARFRRERQALALMSHNYIASVLDAGSSALHRPYFAMELVDGVNITDYAKQHRFTTKQCLELMLLVCEAVHHAHQKGVLHRDLKPTNILVAEIDGHPVPKIIDFGIAKVLHAEAQNVENLAFTARGLVLGTPYYMAPEHATLGSDQVDVRADVFSLGAILYELLTHRLPVEITNAEALPVNELFRRICQTEAIRPSTRIVKTGSFQEHSGKMASSLKGELDWLLLKALERDPDQRYPSVSVFAEDMRRYLQSEPLSVGPPSGWYRLRKLAQRHRAGFILGGAISLSLVTIAAVSMVAARREAVAREHAEDQQRRAERSETELAVENQKSRRLIGFLGDLLEQAGKQVDAGKNPEALRLALDDSTNRLERFEEQPELQATLCGSLAEVYLSMGDMARALPLLRRQQLLLIHVHGRNDPRAQALSLHIARALINVSGDHSAAVEMLTEATAALEKARLGNSKDWFDASLYLANELSNLGMHEEALAQAEKLSTRRNGRNLPANEDTAFLRSVADIQRQAGLFDTAEATLNKALELLPATVKTPKQISARARILQTLARLKLEQGNTALAAQILDEVVVFQRLAWGERNGKLTNGLIESARLHAVLGEVDQALGQTGEALSIARETGNKVEEMHSLRASADIQEDAGRNEAALANRRECEELGREHAPALVTWLDDLSTLSLLLSKMNQHGEAMEKALSLSKTIEDNPDAFTADRDKAITIYSGMIKVAELSRKASGSQDDTADLAKWRQRLAELRALVP